MVHVDVLRARSLDQECVVDSEPGMQKSAQSPPSGFVSLQQRTMKEIFEYREFQDARDSGADRQLEPERLQVQGFIHKAFQVGIDFHSGLTGTAWNHREVTSAEFLNFVGHVGLNRGGKLICEVGNSRHQLAKAMGSASSALRRFCATSSPAIVKRNPFTNW